MSSAYGDNFTSSLPIWINWFLFVFWLLWLGLAILWGIEALRVGILVLLLNLVEVFQLFSIEYYIGCGFVVKWPSLCWDVFPLYPVKLRDFVMNVCWILSNAFYASIEMIMWFFTFINVLYYIDWFVYVETSFWTCDESHFFMVYDLFDTLLGSVG